MKTVEERFRAKYIEQPGPLDTMCHVWVGAKSGITKQSTRPYGMFSVNGKSIVVNRWVYKTFVGEIPDKMQVGHKCRNSLCVNPEHLELVTNRESAMRSSAPTVIAYLTSKCFRGHDLTGDNVLIWKGGRTCRICRKESQDSFRSRKRLERLEHIRKPVIQKTGLLPGQV